MHDDRANAEERIALALASDLKARVVGDRLPVSVAKRSAAGRFEGVASLTASSGFQPVKVGDPWGAPWSTTWFALEATVPTSFAGARVELWCDLGVDASEPGFQAEALAYDADGEIVKAISPRNSWLPVADRALGGERVRFFLEAAANPDLSDERATLDASLFDEASASDEELYRLGRCELVRIDEDARALYADVELLAGVMATLEMHDPRRHRLRVGLCRALDVLDHTGGSPAASRAVLGPLLSSPAAASAHRFVAVGHAHIDSAWLWPMEETVRKCARTLANVLELSEREPSFVFACSQAQQYAWVRQRYPALYRRVREAVARGAIVPVGGMWVEADTNLIGGESLVRQLVYGKRFFLEEFGVECEEGWLPDCFGYCAALPQILVLAGCRSFLTQKLSWNATNRFPHHSFSWEGIDGTRIFTHFPPVDTYNATLSPAELAHGVATFSEHGHATTSLVPFGYGDGGGGPTREMLERAKRLADLEGAPRVELASPSAFFTRAAEELEQPAVYVGELYLERHRGTYTSQARLKRANRRCEHLFKQAELWCATAALRVGRPYPFEELETLWKTVLVHQFHDILPGSSITQVNREALFAFEAVIAALEALVDDALRALCGAGTDELVANAAPHERGGVLALSIGRRQDNDPGAPPVSCTADPSGELALDNGLVSCRLDRAGRLTSLFDLVAGREALAPGAVGNVFSLHADRPNAFDAWELEAFTLALGEELGAPSAIEPACANDDEAALKVIWQVSASRIEQTLRLRRGARRLELEIEVDWRERRRLLKLAFPFDLHATRASYEIAFGHLERATHRSSSEDAARFEVCAHRFVHLREGGYGLAVVNDATYGSDAVREARRGGGTTTTLRFSLLRSPTYPDPSADEGLHRFAFSLVLGASLADALREGYALNVPERLVRGARAVEPLLELEGDGAVIDTVKLAEDRSGDLVVRCYEALGGRCPTRLRARFAVASAMRTDLLERPLAALELEPLGADSAGAEIALELRPFEIVTLRLARGDLDAGELGKEDSGTST